MKKRPQLDRQQLLKSFLIPKLRRVSYQWPPRARAYHTAKRYIKIGKFKNGNDKYKVKFECEHCNKLYDKEQISMDHRRPVVELTGFKDWNTYIDRLFCEENNFSALCEFCHDRKTEKEQEQRKKIKEAKGK